MNVLKKLLDVFLYVFRMVKIEVEKLKFSVKGVELEDEENPGKKIKDRVEPADRVTDFFEVFRSTRLFFLFNVLAFIIFLMLPQGKDVILIVTEDVSSFHLGSLISLLVGVAGWAVFAEFGARYKIYVTDHSGKSLSGNRVNYRKQLQHFFSMIYLLLPFVEVILSVIIVTAVNTDFSSFSFQSILQKSWPNVVIIFALILTAAGLARFYLDDKFNKRFRKGGSVAARIFKLPAEEQNWVNKLYGIYNDYIFALPRESFFNDKNPENGLKKAYKNYLDVALHLPIPEFPDAYLLDEEQVPGDFRPPVHFAKEYRPRYTTTPYKYVINPVGSYRWIYKNRPKFYRVLHLQVRVIAIVSIALILLVSIFSFSWMGSPALVCLSFGCWQGLYTGLLYIDYRYRRATIISARWLIIFWFFLVSYINSDHPVRVNNDPFVTERLKLSDHFDAWMKLHLADTSNLISGRDTASTRINTVRPNKDTTNIARDTTNIRRDSSAGKPYYPIFFITAEGGALRTGAFTAMLLARLQDSFPIFKNNIYAFSTVSGGSVGISFFNAISFIAPPDSPNKAVHYYEDVTKKFLSNDQLAPTLSKMFYGDVLNNFWPVPIQRFDRAIALEKAWEHSYANVFRKPNDLNVYSNNFLSCYNNKLLPVWFINTTEVETGLQCYLTNVRPDSFLFEKDRDLFLNKLKSGINYSTAVNFSTRFPLFSPSAALYQNDDQTFHYVDGGYVENTGSKTMLEVLQRLHQRLQVANVRPYVIQLKFGDSSQFQQTGFLNEISSILNGIYNTRAGASSTYSELLKKEAVSLHGQFIEVPLSATGQEIPMSWVFSNRSLSNLDKVINKVMENKLNDLHKIFPLLSHDRPCNCK